MTLRRKGKFWHYRFKFRGRLFQGSTKCASHRDAVAWERQYKALLALGEVGLAPAPAMHEVWETWLENASSSAANITRAKQVWKYHLEPLIGNLRADEVDDGVVAQARSKYLEKPTLREHSKRKHTEQGANTVMAYLKALLVPLRRQGVLRRLPHFPIPKVQQTPKAFIGEEQLALAWQAIMKTGNLHQITACLACFYLGLREDESLTMRWEWFSDRLKGYTPGKTKGREADPLPVRRELRVFLHALTWGVPQAFGLVLPREGNVHAAHYRQFTTKAVARAGKALGLHLTPHSLRRSCATQMHRAVPPVPLKTIQMMLRHKSIETTMRYIQVGLDDLQAAVERTWGVQNGTEDEVDPAQHCTSVASNVPGAKVS